MTKEELDAYLKHVKELKSQLPDGPWQNEPDRVDFEHRGLTCLVQRNPMGAWCGYVGVTPSHPFHGKDYNALELHAHGGLTYSGECAGHICHVSDGEDRLWWFGFDCAHAGDLIPSMLKLQSEIPPLKKLAERFPETYRDLAYVRGRTEILADELVAAAKDAG